MQIKTEIAGIVRDMTTGSLLNTNNNGLTAYKKQKNKNKEIEQLKYDMDTLKSDINELKHLLTQIIENFNDNRSR